MIYNGTYSNTNNTCANQSYSTGMDKLEQGAGYCADRSPLGVSSVFRLNQGGGDLGGSGLEAELIIRPVISLMPGTMISDGSGTATNPWTVSFPITP